MFYFIMYTIYVNVLVLGSDFPSHSYQPFIKEQTRQAQVSFLFTLGYTEPMFAFRHINFTLPLFSGDRLGIM